MALPTFRLPQDPKTLTIEGHLEEEGPHEKAPGAQDKCFKIQEGRIITTIWRKKLHCVIYQCPLENEKAIRARNTLLFAHYGEGLDWKEVLDNGFGKSYWRADKKLFALWSYAMDFNTFGTQDFHKVMWG